MEDCRSKYVLRSELSLESILSVCRQWFVVKHMLRRVYFVLSVAGDVLAISLV